MKMIEKSSMFSYFFPVSSLYNTHTHTHTHTHTQFLFTAFVPQHWLATYSCCFKSFSLHWDWWHHLSPKCSVKNTWAQLWVGIEFQHSVILGNLLTNATCEAKVSCHQTLHLAHEINQCGHMLAIIFILKGSRRLHNMACLGWLSLGL